MMRIRYPLLLAVAFVSLAARSQAAETRSQQVEVEARFLEVNTEFLADLIPITIVRDPFAGD